MWCRHGIVAAIISGRARMFLASLFQVEPLKTPRCNNRMARLVRAGWVRRMSRVNGLGIAQSLFAAGPAASMWLPEALDLEPQEVIQQCRTSAGPMLIEHSLRALDFRLQLMRDAPEHGWSVDEWRCELECRHAFCFRPGSSVRWRQILVKPDGYVRLRCGARILDCFVEVDLGHVSIPRFAKKLRAYSDYLTSGAFAEAYGSKRLLCPDRHHR